MAVLSNGYDCRLRTLDQTILEWWILWHIPDIIIILIIRRSSEHSLNHIGLIVCTLSVSPNIVVVRILFYSILFYTIFVKNLVLQHGICTVKFIG